MSSMLKLYKTKNKSIDNRTMLINNHDKLNLLMDFGLTTLAVSYNTKSAQKKKEEFLREENIHPSMHAPNDNFNVT